MKKDKDKREPKTGMIKKTINAIKKMSRRNQILLALAVVGVLGFTMIEVTGSPKFCNMCHFMSPYYASWKASPHNGVNCMDCHFEPGVVGYIKGKSVAPAHLINYVLGRAPTKPNALVKDASCLRSECHDAEELKPLNIEFGKAKFSHEKHIGQQLDGIDIACTTCHNRIEGEEHFKVTQGVCFTCHFLKAKESAEKPVPTGCRGCHNIPDIIEFGTVIIDHNEFVSYGASCEKSCHKRQLQTISDVSDGVCLNCHTYRKSQHPDKTELHKIHSNCEKVECFECHDQVEHGKDQATSALAAITCEKCHTETHNAQLGVYTADKHPLEKEDHQIISPMFLTHVECSGCHTEPNDPASGTSYSFGKVAKAVPAACDACHEPGTGAKYIPYWQEQIRKLYDRASDKLKKLQAVDQAGMDDKTAGKLNAAMNEVTELLKLVEADGSWGVHNLKYTEALLIKAERIATDAQ